MKLKALLKYLAEGSESSSEFELSEFKKLKTYKEMISYVRDSGLERIGCGGNRCTYVYSDDKVIKIGKDEEQNRREFEACSEFGKVYCPKIYEHAEDFRWILSERVAVWENEKDFERDTGLNESWLYGAATYQRIHEVPPQDLYEEFSNNQPWDIQDINPNDIGKKIIEKMGYLNINGIDDVSRWDHWGISADGRVVCVDLGLDLKDMKFIY